MRFNRTKVSVIVAFLLSALIGFARSQELVESKFTSAAASASNPVFTTKVIMGQPIFGQVQNEKFIMTVGEIDTVAVFPDLPVIPVLIEIMGQENFPLFLGIKDTVNLEVNISINKGLINQVKFKYRGITKNVFDSIELNTNEDKSLYSTALNGSMLDSIGLQYEIVATDHFNNSDTTDGFFILNLTPIIQKLFLI